MKSYDSEILDAITPIYYRAVANKENLKFFEALEWVGDQATFWVKLGKKRIKQNELATSNR